MKSNDKIPYGSEAYRKLNPHIFGNSSGLRAEATKPIASPSLDSSKPRIQKGEGRVEIRISFVSLRRRLLDPDALPVSVKYLQDAVCATLQRDDGDTRLEFDYLQAKTRGKQRVIVVIEPL